MKFPIASIPDCHRAGIGGPKWYRHCHRQLIRILCGALVIIGISGLDNTALAEPKFIDRASGQPFTLVYDGDWEHFVGGGIAAFDCNGDYFPDLYAAGGKNPAKLLVNQTGLAGRALKFTDLVSPVTDIDHVIGAYPLDIDSDGLLDLFVLRVGENRILRGKGNCRFENVGKSWNFEGSDRWTTAFSATWEKGQALPTLAVGNYVDRDNPDGPFRTCDRHELHRPHGLRYGAPVILEPGYCTLSMLISDWSRTGMSDLRISNDRHYYVRGGMEQLVRLEKAPRFYGQNDGWKSLSIWGMGIASRDISGDGLPEIMLTSMGDQKLLLLDAADGQPSYSLAPYESGTTAHMPYIGNDGRPSSGWHAEFGDVDNDGRDDIFIAKGNVDQMPDAAMNDPNNLLVQNSEGIFVEKGAIAGLASLERSRGAAFVDLDRDGLLDVVVLNRRANIEIHQNRTAESGHWLQIELHQNGVNRYAVGAFIEVRGGNKQWTREITVGGGHAGGHAGVEHFGLGNTIRPEYRIIWPDGETSVWVETEANQAIRVTRTATGISQESL